mmetsp:Transcript_43964/g.109635  ORF Transcript_43964/g.109635 Transcript_43964/m.109635 type:complete len:173 (+) Transcript_43964:271-789(+)
MVSPHIHNNSASGGGCDGGYGYDGEQQYHHQQHQTQVPPLPPFPVTQPYVPFYMMGAAPPSPPQSLYPLPLLPYATHTCPSPPLTVSHVQQMSKGDQYQQGGGSGGMCCAGGSPTHTDSTDEGVGEVRRQHSASLSACSSVTYAAPPINFMLFASQTSHEELLRHQPTSYDD